MAVAITLMNNASKDIVLNKSLSTIATLSGEFRATVDALRPTIIVDGAVASNVNYAYIADFGRYYYVADRQELTKDLTELSLYTDVLQSFATQLANASRIYMMEAVGIDPGLPYTTDDGDKFYAHLVNNG